MRLAVNAWFWDRPHTGSGQYTRRLVEQMAALEPELETWLLAPGAARRFDPVASYALPTGGNLTKLRFEQISFPRACRRLGATVAHVPYWAPPLSPSVPTVVTIHDIIPLLLRPYRGGVLVRTYTALVATAAASAALVITDSQASRQDIIAHLGLPPERVRAIPLAVDERYSPHPATNDAAVAARYGLPHCYTLYLGSFDVRKNVVTALRAYTWAGRVLGADCPLVVAGRLPQRDTPFVPDPRRQAQELGLEPD